MKKLLMILLVFSISYSAFTQTRLPGKVRKAFEAQYPTATDAKWTGIGERVKEWRVLYKLDDVLHSSFYTSKGVWELTKVKIDESELPEAVLKGIKADYFTYDIVITARFEDPENKGYEVWLDNGREGFDVQYSPEGKVLLRTLTSNGYQPIDDDGNFIEK